MMRQLLVGLVALGLPVVTSAAPACKWPAWDRFKAELVSVDGRVIDPSDERLIVEGRRFIDAVR